MTEKPVKLPRLKGSDRPRDIPIQFSAAMEQLESELNNEEGKRRKMEGKLIDMDEKLNDMSEKLNNFYIRLIEIMGIFVAIFSLIVIAGQSFIQIKGDGFFEIAGKSLGYLLPLTLVLLIFILFLNWIVRGTTGSPRRNRDRT